MCAKIQAQVLAAVVAAALSAFGEPGGVSFDFEAISARRFAGAFDPQRNVLKKQYAGKTDKTVSFKLPLPTTNGGVWRVSARYRMRHETPAEVLFLTVPGQERPFKMKECGWKWGEASTLSVVPPGTDTIRLSFAMRRPSKVELEYKDISLVDETPRSPLVLRETPMGNLDGRFAVAESRCGLFEYTWRRTGEYVPWNRISFEIVLPPGIEYVDSSFADKETVKTERRPDGSSVTTFGACRGVEPRTTLTPNSVLRTVVRASRGPGQCGKGRFVVRYKDRKDRAKDFEVEAEPLDFFVVPARTARKPTRYCNGAITGRLFGGLSAAGIEGMSRMIADSGVTWLLAGASKETYDLWRSLGIRRITPTGWQYNNGFQIGRSDILPESDRFVAVDVNPKSRGARALSTATCPVSVYEESDFFRTNTIPYIREHVQYGDGSLSNWEPYQFKYKGCMCAKCCSAFAKYVGRPCDEIAAKWPKCVMKGGEYFDVAEKFRSLEHAKVVKTIDRVVREATGGDSSLGFIPAIAWIEMGSWWRPRDYPAEVKPIYYAGSLRWICPWGPYAKWESDYPYVYTKRMPLGSFFAAQDVRRTVDSDYPEGARPKLMAFPQGFQCGHWVSQPELISMSLDCYFFNGWEAAVVYYFPRGYDARYWNAFAEATDRAARFEDFVLDGRRTDSETSVEPVPGAYASPVRHLSGYLPDLRDVSPLQCVSYDLGGSRIAAVFNFWQRGEAFFTLRAKGLKPGKYEVAMEDGTLRVPGDGSTCYSAEELARGVGLSVGAARTRVFEIRPCGAKTASAAETDEAYAARFGAVRAQLERSAAEDVEYENGNGVPVLDPMHVL